ncbi:MAG TPA: NAD(P)H-binding protein, partial [Chitinophagaceae bacterium]|nr:NAD(P)H-binding protein [Chitinophagaceae bacterium]
MKLVVFGATGSIGIQLVKKALEQGHQVTAFTRSPEKLESFTTSGFRVFKGDILNPENVDAA